MASPTLRQNNRALPQVITPKELDLIQTEWRRTNDALFKAIQLLFEQEAEIRALESVLERKAVVSQEALWKARADALADIREASNRNPSALPKPKPAAKRMAEIRCIRDRRAR